MSGRTAGFSTIECLVALTVFSLGALGAAGTMALGVRAAAKGTHVAAAARLGGEALESLRLGLRLRQDSCVALSPGSRTAPTGEAVQWSLAPTPGGIDFLLSISHATPLGHHVDSIGGFLRCH